MIATQQSDLHPQQMAARLRHLASVLETHFPNGELGYVSVSERNGGRVSIADYAFEQLFRGERLAGTRDGEFVHVIEQKHGIEWESRVYRPVRTNAEPTKEVIQL